MVNKEVGTDLNQIEMVVVAVNKLGATVQEVTANCLGTADKSKSADNTIVTAELLVKEQRHLLTNFVNKSSKNDH